MPGTVRLTLHLLVALTLLACPVSTLAFQQDVGLACCSDADAPAASGEECPGPVCSAFPGSLTILTEARHDPHLTAPRRDCAEDINLAASGPPSRPDEIPPELS